MMKNLNFTLTFLYKNLLKTYRTINGSFQISIFSVFPKIFFKVYVVQWRNVVGLADMAPLGDENAPLIGAPGVRAYSDQFVKKLPKILNK